MPRSILAKGPRFVVARTSGALSSSSPASWRLNLGDD